MTNNTKPQLYFSVDAEADGPYPLDYSMLSFGVSAHAEDGELLDTFEVNLEVLPDASTDPDTMEWWKTQPKAWEACRVNPQPPEIALPKFVVWVKELCKKHDATPVLVAYPAGFDFTFMYVYLRKFAGESPFSFSCLDMKSYASAVLGTPYRDTTKRNFPKHWKSNKHRHNHEALTDALGQAAMFFKMKADAENGKHTSE